jgi:hypothetical protein
MMDVDAVVIVDTSGSMGVHDSRDGQQRYDVACQELAALQARMPGKLAIVSFSDTALLCPTGVPSYLGRRHEPGRGAALRQDVRR